MGAKDIVKIEGRELKSREVDKIALIAPNATINIVREYEIVEKGKVTLLNNVRGILLCPNPNCITNTNEPVKTKFHVIDTNPLMLRCYYCERIMNNEDIEAQFK